MLCGLKNEESQSGLVDRTVSKCLTGEKVTDQLCGFCGGRKRLVSVFMVIAVQGKRGSKNGKPLLLKDERDTHQGRVHNVCLSFNPK